MVQKLLRYGASYAAKYAARKLGTSAVNYAAGAAKRMYRKYTRKSGTRKLKLNNTTAQRDAITRYAARRGYSRSWNKFRLRVRAAIQQDNPRCIYQAFLKGSSVGSAGVTSRFGMYLADLNTTAQGDVANIFIDAYTLASISDAVDKKIFLRAGILDLQVRNSDSAIHMWMDVYEVQARNNWGDSNTLNAQFDGAFAEMSDIGATDVGYPNVTPFQVPNFIRKYKILRSKTYYIEPNKCVNIQHRRKYNQIIEGRDLGDARIKKGVTTGLLCIVRGQPINGATTTGLSGVSYAWSAQFTYHYQEVTGDQITDTIGQTK